MVAVAGTATSVAAIDQQLEPYDAARVDGYRISREACEAIRDRLAAMNDAQRRTVAGLHPDRAPTIVAGCVLLLEALGTFGLKRGRGQREGHPSRRRARRGDAVV